MTVAKDEASQHRPQSDRLSVAELLAKHHDQQRDDQKRYDQQLDGQEPHDQEPHGQEPHDQEPNEGAGRPVRRRAHAAHMTADMGDHPTVELHVGELLRREGRSEPAAKPARGRTRGTAYTLAITTGAAVLCAAVLGGVSVVVNGRQHEVQAAKELFIGEKALEPNIIGAALNTVPLSISTPSTGAAVTTQDAGPDGSSPTNSDGQPSQFGQPTGSDDSKVTTGNPTTGNPTAGNPTAGNAAGGDLARGTAAGNPAGGNGGATPPDPDVATGTSPTPASQGSGTPGTQTTAGGAPEEITALVDTFFATAPTDPNSAFSLLAPQMQAGGLPDFQASWRGVRAATIEKVVLDGNHAARVIVLYAWQDGRRVRTEQRLVVSGGVDPHITDAAVLSARGG